MALLALQQVKVTGLNPSYTAAAASDTVQLPDVDRVFVVYKNTNAATRVISVVTPAKLDQFGQSLPDVQVTIAATTGLEVIPLNRDFADDNGVVTLTVSATANVTVGAFRI